MSAATEREGKIRLANENGADEIKGESADGSFFFGIGTDFHLYSGEHLLRKEISASTHRTILREKKINDLISFFIGGGPPRVVKFSKI